MTPDVEMDDVSVGQPEPPVTPQKSCSVASTPTKGMSHVVRLLHMLIFSGSERSHTPLSADSGPTRFHSPLQTPPGAGRKDGEEAGRNWRQHDAAAASTQALGPSSGQGTDKSSVAPEARNTDEGEALPRLSPLREDSNRGKQLPS